MSDVTYKCTVELMSVNFFISFHFFILFKIHMYCDGVKDHTTSGLQQKNPGGWVLLKRRAGAKRGVPCCAANHSLCVLDAVDRSRALVLSCSRALVLSCSRAVADRSYTAL